MRDFEEIRSIKREYAFSLLSKSGVVGVGIGPKEVQGRWTETISITILVEEKINTSLLPLQDRIPGVLNGVPTDVISMGCDTESINVPLRQSRMPGDDRTRRWRPAPAGVSVGHYLLKGAGTLGGWFRYSNSGELFMLSCWHVIANMGNCKKGDPILQPAVLDGGKLPDDVIAYLDKWVDVKIIVPTQSLDDARKKLKELLEFKSEIPTNYVDVATAKSISDTVVSGEVLGIKVEDLHFPPADLKWEQLVEFGDQLIASGRTAGVAQVTYALDDLDLFVRYPIGIALFVDQIGFKPGRIEGNSTQKKSSPSKN